MSDLRPGDGLPEQFFVRQDEQPDEAFYAMPRFVAHVDDATLANLTAYYREVLPSGGRLLDLMSSWISHLPQDHDYAHVAGLGMNAEELDQNNRLDQRVVHNLNQDPALPYRDDEFDAVMIVVSIQYLTQPFEVFREVSRVLAPGGRIIVALSHRLFPTKAIYAFQVLPPAERCQLVASYMAATGSLTGIEMLDRSPPNADPLWLVTGTKSG